MGAVTAHRVALITDFGGPEVLIILSRPRPSPAHTLSRPPTGSAKARSWH
jgi:hypothetical protein